MQSSSYELSSLVSGKTKCKAKATIFFFFFFFSSYNVWKHVRYRSLISRHPG